MALRTRNELPPAGWLYTQKADDGKTVLKEFKGMIPFNDFVNEVLDLRKGNNLQRANFDDTAADIEEATGFRLGYDPRWWGQKKTSLYQVARALPSHVLQAAKHVVEHAENAVRGAHIIKDDWLGKGRDPVARDLAQQRANICILCEFNRDGHFFQKLTASIAKAIHEQRRLKTGLGLKVDGEDQLHTCQKCDCHLPLKIFTSIDTIKERTSLETINDMPGFCWVRKESIPA